MSEINKALKSLGGLGPRVAEIRDELRDGGPPVDEAAILYFIAGNLDKESHDAIAAQIVTWKSWYQAYWQTQVELDLDEQHSTSAPLVDVEPPTWIQPKATVAPSDPRRSSSISSPRRRMTAIMVIATSVLSVCGIAYWATRATPPVLIAQLDDGFGQIRLERDGTIQGLDAYPVEYRRRAQSALMNGRFGVSPAVKELTDGVREQGVRASDDPYAAFVRPVNSAVESTQPTLAWNAPKVGAEFYEVAVYDVAGREVKTERTTATEWEIPESLLKRGAVYSWRFVAIKDDEQRPAPPKGVPAPKFYVLDDASLKRIREAEQRLEGSHLLLSLLYAENGLLDAAEIELRELIATNRGTAVLAKMLKSLEAQRRGDIAAARLRESGG